MTIRKQHQPAFLTLLLAALLLAAPLAASATGSSAGNGASLEEILRGARQGTPTPRSKRAASDTTTDSSTTGTDAEPLTSDEIADAPEADPFGGQVDALDTGGETLVIDNNGALDGIYKCSLALSKPLDIYVSVNGKSNGQSIFVIADLGNDGLVQGWGIGQISNGSSDGNFLYSGTTSDGKGFSLDAQYDADGNVSATGKATLVDASDKTKSNDTDFTCHSLW
jgi:hypothetical protein